MVTKSQRARGARLALLGAVAAVGTLVLAACGAGGSADTAPAATAPRGGGAVSLEVPDVVISTYQGEAFLGQSEVTLSEVVGLGKPVVVNFWAALCPPCRAEMPDFQRVHEARGHEVTIVGIDVGPFLDLGSREEGRELLASLEVTYAAGTTFDESVIRNFRVLGMPTSVFLRADGSLLRSWSGLLTEAKINEFIDQLLAA